MSRLPLAVGWILLVVSGEALAQQRPLATEDPEPIGGGRVLIEGGIHYVVDQEYPGSGLTGDLWRLPTLGVSLGISSIAEFQIDGGVRDHLAIDERVPAPLDSFLNVTGDTTGDFQDLVVATKLRLLSERAGRPAIAMRVATKLPLATNESGLGLDTTDFYVALLVGKTVQSVRLVGNVGLGILADPTVGSQQNDVLTYAFSLARALTDRSEIVGELNGRVSTRADPPHPGSETRALLNFGARFTSGAFRLDGGLFVGLTDFDPTVGFTGGFTYVFNAFQMP
jgi:hypothetical protein